MWSNHVAVFCHVIHYIIVGNSSLENSEREQGHLSRYYSNCKNTSRIVFRERAYSATGNSRVHYFEIWLRHPANCIPVGQGLYAQFTRPFPLLRKWVWLARLGSLLRHRPENGLVQTESTLATTKKKQLFPLPFPSLTSPFMFLYTFIPDT